MWLNIENLDLLTRVTRDGAKPKNQGIKYIFVIADRNDTNSH